MSNQATIRAICKAISIQPPTLHEIEEFSKDLFFKVDIDHSKSISSSEYAKWVKMNWELQDFFLKYAEIQTFEGAMRRTTDYFIEYMRIFKTLCKEGETTVPAAELKSRFIKDFPKINETAINMLFRILIDTSQDIQKDLKSDVVLQRAYEDVIKAWSAFTATDINFDNSISITELKYLIYAFEKDIPTHQRIQEDMEFLDRD